MPGILTPELMQTPGVRRFVEGMIGDLSSGRNLLVLLPFGADQLPVWESLRHEAWRREFHICEVWLTEVPVTDPPPVALAEKLEIPWLSPDAPRTTENLILSIGQSDIRPDVIFLGDFAGLEEDGRRVWEEFLVQWVHFQQTTAKSWTSGALCMVAPAHAVSSRVPHDSAGLSVRRWWGMPSTLEMQLLCRVGEDGTSQEPRGRWREFQLPALAGSDVVLADFLWDRIFSGIARLVESIHEFGRDNYGWTEDKLIQWKVSEVLLDRENHGYHGLGPPERMENLWGLGVLWWTPEYGIEVHTAALGMLGRKEDLIHRIWRGQTPLLLPFIDRVRLAICSYITEHYGDNWPVRWWPPPGPEDEAAVKKSPLACSWGHLGVLLGDCDGLRQERRWLPLVTRMRQIRNELAHYRAVSFGDFEMLWAQYQHARKMGLP